MPVQALVPHTATPPAAGLVTLVLLIVLVEQWATKPAPVPLARSCLAPGSYVGDTTAPEGEFKSRVGVRQANAAWQDGWARWCAAKYAVDFCALLLVLVSLLLRADAPTPRLCRRQHPQQQHRGNV